jgi:hypothetical protein
MMSNEVGRYYAFHAYDGDRFLSEVVNVKRMDAVRERDEYIAMGFRVVGCADRTDSLFELSDGPLFETPVYYNEPLVD